MQRETTILSSDAPKTKVVVICHEADWREAKSIISEFAPIGWAELEEIKLLEMGTRIQFRENERGTKRYVSQDPASLRRALDRIAPDHDAPRVLIVGNVKLYPALTPYDARAPVQVPSTAELRRLLPQILVSSGLDWLSRLLHFLGHYHIEINREAVGAWRAQFRVFGGEWVGDALLKLQDFWPSRRVSEALFRPPSGDARSTDDEIDAWLKEYDYLAFNHPDSGDSSTMVCRLAKTRIGRPLADKRSDFKNCVENASSPARILFLEDCIATGKEIVELLDKLPPEKIRLHKIDVRFAVGTCSALRRLEAYLKAKEFSNIRVLPPSDGLVENLTKEALALPEGDLFDDNGEFLRPSEHMISGIDLRARDYFNKSQRKAIISLSKAIGGPLMSLRMRQMGWQPERIEANLGNWKLGFGGLGLLLAFAHGVPKPALPLLWVEGGISVEHFGYRWQGSWIPLFPRPLEERLAAIRASGAA